MIPVPADTTERRSWCIPPASSTSRRDPRRGVLDPRRFEGEAQGARRRPEPDPADEAPVRGARRARRHQPRFRGLDTLAEEGGGLRIGALVRHKTCERSALLTRPLRRCSATPRRSSPTRSCATSAPSCGSLAHADPQGDWGSVMLARAPSVVVRARAEPRTIPIDEFLQGPFTTALAAERVRSPRSASPTRAPRSSGTYLKLERKVGDFATAAVAVHARSNGTSARPASRSPASAPTNIRASAAEEALGGAEPTDDVIQEAARLAAEAAEPQPTCAAPPSTSATSSGSSPSAALRHGAPTAAQAAATRSEMATSRGGNDCTRSR